MRGPVPSQPAGLLCSTAGTPLHAADTQAGVRPVPELDNTPLMETVSGKVGWENPAFLPITRKIPWTLEISTAEDLTANRKGSGSLQMRYPEKKVPRGLFKEHL